MRNSWRWFVAAAAAAAFLGALAITAGHGPGLDPDSMAYVGAATSLAHGRGLQVPLGKWERADSSVELTVWPPGFSAAMAVPQAAGLAPLAAARLVIAASAAATIALAALILGEILATPALVGALAAIFLTPSFVAVHLSVLSEPLFIASLALTLFAMTRERPGIAAIGATLAAMTRYAGASAAVGAAIWFLFFGTGKLRRRVARSALASAPAALAFSLWMIHNSRVHVVQSAIAVGYNPGIVSTLREGLMTLLSWIAPTAGVMTATLLALAALAAVAMAIFAPGRRPSAATDTERALMRCSAAASVLLASYLAILVFSRLFVGGAIRFDARILSPAIFLLEMLVIPACVRISARRGRGFRLAAAAAAVLWMVAAVRAELPVVLDSIEDGNDFAASDWRESPTTEWIRNEGRRYAIYTNWPAAVFFDAGRNAYDIPTSADGDTLALFGKILKARHGVLAAFNVRSLDYPPIDSIAAGAGLVRIRTLPDGAIWAPPPTSN